MAVKACVSLTGTVCLAGATKTFTEATGAEMVRAALEETLESATDVAIREIVGGLGTVPGAV